MEIPGFRSLAKTPAGNGWKFGLGGGIVVLGGLLIAILVLLYVIAGIASVLVTVPGI